MTFSPLSYVNSLRIVYFWTIPIRGRLTHFMGSAAVKIFMISKKSELIQGGVFLFLKCLDSKYPNFYGGVRPHWKSTPKCLDLFLLMPHKHTPPPHQITTVPHHDPTPTHHHTTPHPVCSLGTRVSGISPPKHRVTDNKK